MHICCGFRYRIWHSTNCMGIQCTCIYIQSGSIRSRDELHHCTAQIIYTKVCVCECWNAKNKNVKSSQFTSIYMLVQIHSKMMVVVVVVVGGEMKVCMVYVKSMELWVKDRQWWLSKNDGHYVYVHCTHLKANDSKSFRHIYVLEWSSIVYTYIYNSLRNDRYNL